MNKNNDSKLDNKYDTNHKITYVMVSFLISYLFYLGLKQYYGEHNQTYMVSDVKIEFVSILFLIYFILHDKDCFEIDKINKNESYPILCLVKKDKYILLLLFVLQFFYVIYMVLKIPVFKLYSVIRLLFILIFIGIIIYSGFINTDWKLKYSH